MQVSVPVYFDYLIEAYQRGEAGRHVHLGYWDDAPAGNGKLAPAEFERAQNRLVEYLISRSGLLNGQVVLDVGCGFGGTLALINSRFHGMQLHGLNLDPRQLQICTDITPANDNTIRWEAGDAAGLSQCDDSIDRMLCIEAMFHFSSRRAFFMEAGRVLRRGGYLVASDIQLSAADPGASVEQLVQAMVAGYGPWPDPWGLDADYRQLADAAGLTCTSIDDVSLQTLPSHRFTAPGHTNAPELTGDTALDAALVMQYLHQQGILRYLFLVFTKADIDWRTSMGADGELCFSQSLSSGVYPREGDSDLSMW